MMFSVQLGHEDEAAVALPLGFGAIVEARKRETTVSLFYASRKALTLLPILWRTHRLPVGTSGMSELSSRIDVTPYGLQVQLILARYHCRVRRLHHALHTHALAFASLTAGMWRLEAS